MKYNCYVGCEVFNFHGNSSNPFLFKNLTNNEILRDLVHSATNFRTGAFVEAAFGEM